tara:strand:- start:4635 stop:4772 length:138 start_codon:yes stop_codon:yes gene_type:complete
VNFILWQPLGHSVGNVVPFLDQGVLEVFKIDTEVSIVFGAVTAYE